MWCVHRSLSIFIMFVGEKEGTDKAVLLELGDTQSR